MQIFGTLTPTIMFHFQLMNIIVCNDYWTFLYINGSIHTFTLCDGVVLYTYKSMWLYLNCLAIPEVNYNSADAACTDNTYR